MSSDIFLYSSFNLRIKFEPTRIRIKYIFVVTIEYPQSLVYSRVALDNVAPRCIFMIPVNRIYFKSFRAGSREYDLFCTWIFISVLK